MQGCELEAGSFCRQAAWVRSGGGGSKEGIIHTRLRCTIFVFECYVAIQLLLLLS